MGQTELATAFAELEETLRQAQWAASAIEASASARGQFASGLIANARSAVLDIRRSLEARQVCA